MSEVTARNVEGRTLERNAMGSVKEGATFSVQKKEIGGERSGRSVNEVTARSVQGQVA